MFHEAAIALEKSALHHSRGGRSESVLLFVLTTVAACAGPEGSPPDGPLEALGDANAVTDGADGDADVPTVVFPSEFGCNGEPVIRRDPFPSIDFVAVGDPAVLVEPSGSEIKMYYTCAGVRSGAEETRTRVCLATSTDGIAWTKSIHNPVFEASETGWDSRQIETVYVTRTADSYFLYYMGYDLGANPELVDCGEVGRVSQDLCWYLEDQANGNINHTFGSLGVATSSDGIAWTRASASPLWRTPSCPAWDCFATEGPTVLQEGGVFRMWYGAHGSRDGSTQIFGIGYAESTDGLHWERMADEPLLASRPGEWDGTHVLDPDVVKLGEESYVLLHSGSSAEKEPDTGELSGFRDMHIGLATSADGLSWTRADNPLIRRNQAAWASYFLSFPATYVQSDRVDIFFHGIDKNAADYAYWDIGRCSGPRRL